MHINGVVEFLLGDRSDTWLMDAGDQGVDVERPNVNRCVCCAHEGYDIYWNDEWNLLN